MDPRLGTDTSGPGEAVFAIRFDGKLDFQRRNREKRPQKKFNDYFHLSIKPVKNQVFLTP